MTFDQSEFDIRCEWGKQGVLHLAPISDVVVIVDVLSFSTAVDIATNRGAIVFPYEGRDQSAAAFAHSVGAIMAAAKRSSANYTLSPRSLLQIPKGTRLVLPSPNGSALTLSTGTTPTLAGCLRNYRAVASAAQRFGKRIAVIAAGERWRNDGSLRPSFEDWIGAGAIIGRLTGKLSPEAWSAANAFSHAQDEMGRLLHACSSGKELVESGFAQDVELAAALNISEHAPEFVSDAYI